MKLLVYICACCLFWNSAQTQTFSNEVKAAKQMVDAEQKIFRDFLKTAPFNATTKNRLQKFAINDVNARKNNLPGLVTTAPERRVYGIRSLAYFMRELREDFAEKKINEGDVNEILAKYKQILSDLLGKNARQRIATHLTGNSWRNCQLLTNVFWEFGEKKELSAISTYKRVTETPEYIFSFLQNRPDFEYGDSLIVFMAQNYPEELVSYLQKTAGTVVDLIRNSKNIYVQELVSLSANSLASELAPFTEQLVNKELTVDDILAKRKKVDDYFRLLVDVGMGNVEKAANGTDPPFQPAVVNALSEKALDFYVKKINDLHALPEGIRFQCVQSLRPQDIYYVIVHSDEEMYTSTYLGLYRRLMASIKEQPADSILNLVKMYRFRKFMRIAATYNTLLDFLKQMAPGKSAQLIHLFISDIEQSNEDEAVANASDIADAFINLSKDSTLNATVKQELDLNLGKANQDHSKMSERLYSVLEQVYELVNSNNDNDFSAGYRTIALKTFEDKGTVSELVTFYGDEDGKKSYASFINLFWDKSKWKMDTNGSWITITSLRGQPVKIYANLPLNDDEEADIAAQDTLFKYLEAQSIHPAILIHRGHSYHLANTLKYLTPSVKLAILGSCGGYKNMKKIIEINPDIHIIASRQVGSMIVNDPLLNLLNNDLVEAKDIDWVSFWNELSRSFAKDPAASRVFEEYTPPYKNVSSYVVKLYEYETGEPE